jgi:hypothetical protein
MPANFTINYPPANWKIPLTFRTGGAIQITTAGTPGEDDLANYMVVCEYENDTMVDLGYSAVSTSLAVNGWQCAFYSLPAGENGVLTATLQRWDFDTFSWVDVAAKTLTGLSNVETGAGYIIPPRGLLSPSFLIEGQCTADVEILCYLLDNAGAILAAGFVNSGSNINEWTAQFYGRAAGNQHSILAEFWDPDTETKSAEHTVTGVGIGV